MSFIKSIFNKVAFSKEEAAKNTLSLNKVIKKFIYVLVILIPLWFLPITVNAVEFNKQALMILLVVVILILWLIKALNQGRISWKRNILNIVIGVFLIVFTLATIFSLRPYNSLVGWSTHLSGSLMNVLAFVALYFLIINTFKGLKEVFGLLFSFLVSSAIVSIVGLLQLLGGYIFPWDFTKIVSFNMIGTVNSFGIFSAVILILVTALLFVIKRPSIKIFLLIFGIVNLFILLLLNFWILWVILGVGMILILIFSLVRLISLEEKISWIALPMTLLALSLMFFFFKPALPVTINLPTEVGLSYKSGFDITFSTLKEKPILGSGPETFVFNYTKLKPEGINRTVFWNTRFSNPPSEIFSIASDLGILGLISFLAFVILFIIQATKNLVRTIEKDENILKRFLEIGLFSAWFGLLVAWFLYPQNFVLIFTFWLLLALYLAESSVFKTMVYNLRKSPKVLLITSFSFVIVIVIVVGFLYLQGTRFIGEINYKKGLDLIQKEDKLDLGINKIISATVINPYEDRTYRTLGQLFLVKMNRDSLIEGLDQQERLNLIQIDAINAINSSVRATTLSPNDVSNWLVRADVYSKITGLVDGSIDWADASYDEAIKIEPINPFIFTQKGKLAIIRANMIAPQVKESKEAKDAYDGFLELALENFNRAIELKPDYAPAHFQSALVFEARGELLEAIKKMEINRQLLPQDTGVSFQLAVLYYRFERYDLAKAEFTRATVLDPNFSNARFFLGILYDRERNTEDALDQFYRIAELNPDNEQVKQIISNLKAGKPALDSGGPPKEPAETPIQEKPEDQ